MKQSILSNKKNMAVSILAGTMTAIILSVLAAILITILIDKDLVNINRMYIYAFVVWLGASYVGTIVAGTIEKNKMILSAVASASVYYVLLISIKVAISDMPFSGMITGCIIICIGSALGIFSVQCFTRGKRTKFRYKG